MIQILLLLFLLLIVIYIVSYFQINIENFSNPNENLMNTMNLIDSMTYDEENNHFFLNDKKIGGSSFPFRIGMWEFDTGNVKTYLNFTSNMKLGYFYEYERNYSDTFIFERDDKILTFVFQGNTYELIQKNINEYENADASVFLKKMTEFTIKTNSSGNKSTTCGEKSGEVSEFFLNDIKYENVSKSTEGNIDDYGLHILVLNDNGSISDYQHFNTHLFMNQYINAISYIKSIEQDKIVALNVYGDASKYGQPTIQLYQDYETVNLYGVIRHFTSPNIYNINANNNESTIFASSIIYENFPRRLSSVKISQGLSVQLFDKLNGGWGNSNHREPQILEFSYDSTNNGVKDLTGSNNDKVESIKLDIDTQYLQTYYNIYMTFKLIGGPIMEILYENQALSIIGRKDELLGNAEIATERPQVIFCENKPRGYSPNTVSASRNFVLEAFKEPEDKMKINVISLGSSAYKGYQMHRGYSEFYLNNKQIANFTSRGINAVILNPDGTIFNQSSFDTSGDNANSNRFVNYIKSVPNGKIVCLSVYDEMANRLNPHVRLYYEPNNVDEYYKLFYDENTQGRFNDFRYRLESVWCQNASNRRMFQYNFNKDENVDMMPNPFRNNRSRIKVEGIQNALCNMPLSQLNSSHTVTNNIQWTLKKVHTVEVAGATQFTPDPNRMLNNIPNGTLIHPANKWDIKSIKMTPRIKVEFYEGKNFSGELLRTVRYSNTTGGNYNIPSSLFNRIGSIKLVPDSEDNIITFSDSLRSCGLVENIVPNYRSSFAFIGTKGDEGNSVVMYNKSNRYRDLRVDNSDEPFANFEEYANVEMEI